MNAKTLCLGLLTRGEASGYEIKKQMEQGPLAHFYRAGFGSIYPALSRLDEEGFVTCTEMVQAKRPGKKVYRITESGIAAFKNALRAQPSDDWMRSDCLFMMFFSEFLEPGRMKEVFEKYLGFFRGAAGTLREMELCGANPGRRFVHGFGLALYEAMVEFMENNRDLLEEDSETKTTPADERQAGALG